MVNRNLPKAFVDRLRKEFGAAAEDLIQNLHNTEPAARTLRVLEQVDPYEIQGFQGFAKVPWCESAQWFTRDNTFDTLPIHHYPGYQAGAWHIQEASGLLIDDLLRQIRIQGLPMNRMLDACAAPGGKSLTMLQYLPERGILVAADAQKDRLLTLMETISRTGDSRIMVIKADARDWGQMVNFWDGICVDMPCSGEGMFRKHDDALQDWSLAKSESCSRIQEDILESLVHSLRPGGWLIYSTCTFGFSENTGIVLPLVERGLLQPLDLKIPEEWGFTPAAQLDPRWPAGGGAWWAIPGKVQGEGFFCAVLQKVVQDDSLTPQISCDPAEPTIVEADQLISSCPPSMKIMRNGIPLWTREGVPSQDLAHALGKRSSDALQEQVKSLGLEWNDVPLEKPLATWFLQGQALALGDLQQGWNLMCYQGLGLGWMHLSGDRVLNYFPKSRRIRR